MTGDPSAISGLLGLALVFAVTAILGLLAEWVWTRDD